MAEPVWTPKAPRRGDERTEADEVGRQAELRSSDEAAKLPSNRGINHRQTRAVRPAGPSGEAASPSSHPDQFFSFQINSLLCPLVGHCLFAGPVCGSFGGVFLGPTFTSLKDVKQLIQVSKPLSEYSRGREFKS